MKSSPALFSSLIAAAAGLLFLFASVQLAVALFAAGGLIAIAIADYRREFKPLCAPMPMAGPAAFAPAEELELAA